MAQETPVDLGRPEVRCLLVAERVIREVDSGQHTIVGVLDVMWVRAVPVSAPLWLYAEITNLRQPTRLTFRVVAASDLSKVLFLTEKDLPFKNRPLAVLSFRLYLGQVTFPESGAYRVEVVDGESVLQSRILKVLLPTDKNEEDFYSGE